MLGLESWPRPLLVSTSCTWWILLKRLQSSSVSWPARSLALTRSSISEEPRVGPSCSGCGVCRGKSAQIRGGPGTNALPVVRRAVDRQGT